MNKTNPSHSDVLPWVSRKVTKELHTQLVQAATSATSAVLVYLITGPAGSGKTFLGRDLGVLLNSQDGYTPGQEGSLYWPGILDVFDPSTNNNFGLETRIRESFGTFGFHFEDYERERNLYELRYKTGYRGPSMEKQRQVIEAAFARGMAEISAQGYPIIPIDTIERLDISVDDVQQQLQLQSDTASVVGWLLFQITEMERGAVILLGRPTRYFEAALRDAIRQAQEKGARIELRETHLESLDPEDLDAFYDNRVQRYPDLEKILSPRIRKVLAEKTKLNPLSLDMALQALLETANPRIVLDILQKQHGKQDETGVNLLQAELLEAYMDVLSDQKRKTLLHYLAVARNGLFDELLRHLQPKRADQFIHELTLIAQLPFIKVRNVYINIPDLQERRPRPTYFLHDEMYLLYDRQIEKDAGLIHTIVEDSERIANWYEHKIAAGQEQDAKRALEKISDDLELKGIPSGSTTNDLIVESLLYRLRANPQKGYNWYLFQEDYAIRNSISIGLDMRLRDEVGRVVNTAFAKKGEPGYSLSSAVDRENILHCTSDLLKQYQVDSAILWVKRLSARGKQDEAIRVAEHYLPIAEEIYLQNSEEYVLLLAELLLWYGQALMYNAKTNLAIEKYQRVLKLLNIEKELTEFNQFILESSLDALKIWRRCLVGGRALNNLGYLYWRNRGQYRLAIQYYQYASSIFRVASLAGIKGVEEEAANTMDNTARVYSELGFDSRAIDLVRRGLDQRKKLGLSYRKALSNCSHAIILSTIGDYDKALEEIDNALLDFGSAETGRGKGIASIIRGTLLRRKAEEWRETGQSRAAAVRETESAEAALRQAADIFAANVLEPLLLVQVYNELGCCLRARYFLLRDYPGAANYLPAIYTQAEASLKKSMLDASTHELCVERLDSLQDLSVLYLRANQLDKALQSCKEIEDFIKKDALNHTIRPGIGLEKLDKENSIDAYYKLLGQVELTEGAINYAQGGGDIGPIDSKTYIDTIKHYIFALIYFRHYSTETYSLQRTFGRMYKRFEKCDFKTQNEIVNNVVPTLIDEYKLPAEPIRDFLADIFGFSG